VKVQSSPSASDLFSLCLASNLMDCVQKMETEQFDSFSFLLSTVSSHEVQRSTHSLIYYCTSSSSTSLQQLKMFVERKNSLRQTRTPIKKKVNSMKESVSLPKGYQRNDWINEHVETFVEQTQKLFDTVSARCDCPEMTAGPGYSYLWADGVKVKKTYSSASC